MNNTRESTNHDESTKEKDITQDDLQAMKDMICGMRRDPSLIYRLNSLSAEEGDLRNVNTENDNNNNISGNHVFLHSNALAANNALNKSIEVDDDHTEVSSLGMMSYEDSGTSLLNQSQQFSPHEKIITRANRDVEIALRMQSLRAKRELFDSTRGRDAALARTESAMQINKTPSQLNRSISAPLNQAMKLKQDEKVEELKIPSEQPSTTPSHQRGRSHTSPSVSLYEDYLSKREENNWKPLENNERDDSVERKCHSSKQPMQKALVDSSLDDSCVPVRKIERKPSIPRQDTLNQPELNKSQRTLITRNSIERNVGENKKGRDSNISDGETHKSNKDDESVKTASIMYNEGLKSTDVPSYNENRKRLSRSFDPTSLNGDLNLPFQGKDSHHDMANNLYYNAISKYSTKNNNARDGLADQFKRSSSLSSQSASRRNDNSSRKLRSNSIESESNKTRQSEESERRRAKNERPLLEKQKSEYKREKKTTKSKRAEKNRGNLQSALHDVNSSDVVSRRVTLSSSEKLPELHDMLEGIDHPYRSDKSTYTPNKEGEEDGDKMRPANPSFGSLDDHALKEEGLGEQLQRLNQRDKNYHEQEGQSSRSVISRFSYMVKGKTGRRESERSMESHQDKNSSIYSNITPKKSIESDDGSYSKSRTSLISRLHLGSMSSPHQSQRRRTTTLDTTFNSSSTPSDWDKTTIRSATERETPFMTNETSRAKAIRTGLGDNEMERVCDEKGRCVFHPHIRLQKQKLFGGWKIIFKHCPDCAVEHMKKTQKELAAKQLKSKRKKLKEKKDPLINDISEINFHLDESHQKKSRKHKTKKKHSSPENFSPSEEPHTNSNDNYFSDLTLKDPMNIVDHLIERTLMKYEHPEVEKDERYEDSRQSISRDRNTVHYSNQKDERQQQLVTVTSDDSKELEVVPYKSPQNDEWEKKERSQSNHSLAIVETKQPRMKNVNGLPWSDYNGQSGRYTGEVNDEYQPHGRGEMVYDRGVVSSGVWYKGVLDREGPLTQDEYVPKRLTSYSVGDKGRDEDMVIKPKKETAAAVALLRIRDAAFVQRSGGSWTYAVVKDRATGNDAWIKFKVNARGSTKSFPMSQWGTYIRIIKWQATDAPAKKSLSLDKFLTNNRSHIGSSHSVAGNLALVSSDHSVGSARSLPMIDRSRTVDYLTTGKINIRTRSRSRSRNRKNVTTLPTLFSSSMSVTEENEGNDNDGWETVSGSGYRLRGIDP